MGLTQRTCFGNYNRLIHVRVAVHGSLPPLFPHFFFEIKKKCRLRGLEDVHTQLGPGWRDTRSNREVLSMSDVWVRGGGGG